MRVDLEKWLGQMSVSEFLSEDEIQDYFTVENCQTMWPFEEIDEQEMNAARHFCVAEWSKTK